MAGSEELKLKAELKLEPALPESQRLSANGAEYESQGQARSASPLVYKKCGHQACRADIYTPYYAPSGLHTCVLT